jgi:hypothetical protein
MLYRGLLLRLPEVCLRRRVSVVQCGPSWEKQARTTAAAAAAHSILYDDDDGLLQNNASWSDQHLSDFENKLANVIVVVVVNSVDERAVDAGGRVHNGRQDGRAAVNSGGRTGNGDGAAALATGVL